MKKSELEKAINDFNTTLINYIIEEIQKVIFLNNKKNPIDLYDIINEELNNIYSYLENTYEFKISEDVYLHVEEYINPYAEAAYREINNLALEVTESETISELMNKSNNLSNILKRDTYIDYSDTIKKKNKRKQ